MMRLLWLVCLMLPVTVARADEPIHLVYFHMPPFADEANGKAVGPAVDLVRELTAGFPVVDEPVTMPFKRIEYALKTEKTVAIGLGRNARRP